MHQKTLKINSLTIMTCSKFNSMLIKLLKKSKNVLEKNTSKVSVISLKIPLTLLKNIQSIWKSVCDNSICYFIIFCWTDPQCFKIPKPYPDYDAPGFHDKHVSETSNYKSDIKKGIDDYRLGKQLFDFITKHGY